MGTKRTKTIEEILGRSFGASEFENSESDFDEVIFDAPKVEADFARSPRTAQIEQTDVLVITAIDAEREGFLKAFDAFGRTLKQDQSFRFSHGLIIDRLEYDNYSIALALQPSMGMASSTSLTTRAILALNPAIVAMTGICAGRRGKTKIGDIIIPEFVYDFTAGKQNEESFGPRPHPIQLNYDYKQYITSSICENNYTIVQKILNSWQGEPRQENVCIHKKPFVSGTSVINDPNIIEQISNRQDDFYGLDMEAYGFALAADALSKKWIVLKGVQDYADGDKTTVEKSGRAFAAFASAMLFKLMLPDLLQIKLDEGE